MIGKLKNDHNAERKGRGRGYNESALVIVDEVGYTPIGREECNLFFRFIANRYEKASTIITSNLLCGAPHNKFNAESIVMRRGRSLTLTIMQSFQ